MEEEEDDSGAEVDALVVKDVAVDNDGAVPVKG